MNILNTADNIIRSFCKYLTDIEIIRLESVSKRFSKVKQYTTNKPFRTESSKESNKKSKYVIVGYPLTNLQRWTDKHIVLDSSDPTDLYNVSKNSMVYIDIRKNKIKTRRKCKEDDIYKYILPNQLNTQVFTSNNPFSNINNFPELVKTKFPNGFENEYVYHSSHCYELSAWCSRSQNYKYIFIVSIDGIIDTVLVDKKTCFQIGDNSTEAFGLIDNLIVWNTGDVWSTLVVKCR